MGREAAETHATQQREFERLRADTAKAGSVDGEGGDVASADEDLGSSQDNLNGEQPTIAPDLDAILQPFREIDPEASEVLEQALGPLYAALPELQAAQKRAGAAEAAMMEHAVAGARRELQGANPQLAQPDVWSKVDAKAQELAQSGGKYLEPATLNARISLAITDALKLVSPSSDPLSGAATGARSTGGVADTLAGRDPLDLEISGYLDS
jgi:hypothetical protein